MRRYLAWAVAILAAVALVVTLVGLIHSNIWWIRVLDFSRPAFLIAIGVVAIIGGLTIRARWGLAVAAALALAAGLQAWRIWPYFAIAPIEVVDADGRGPAFDATCFTALGLNVYQHNRDYDATRRLITRVNHDILLLMETDARWVAALHAEIAAYPSHLLRPIDNTYGLVFATRLAVRSMKTVNITDQNTPTVYAQLLTRSGEPFDYIGLHPRPPRPGQDTDRRDRKIEHAALAIAGHRIPAMAMGDFNDVAWSRTTRLFQQVGGYLDPRAGRGSFPTFPAKYAAIGWPLDQMFVSPAFTVRRIDVLENVGSDHRPLLAELCLNGDAARRAARSMTEAENRAAGQ